MDLGDWLGRGLALTWRYKSLWVFGFLAALGTWGIPSTQGQFNPSEHLPSNFNEAFRRLLDENWPWIALILLILFLISLFAQLVALWGQGALILGSEEAAEGRPPVLGALAQQTTARLLRLIGIIALLGAPSFLATLVFLLGSIVSLLLAFAQPTERVQAATLLIVILGTLAFMGCLLPLTGVLHLWSRLAVRAALLEDLPWLQALRRGLEVGLKEFGYLLLVWLVVDIGVLGVTALVFSFLSSVPLLIISGALLFALLQSGVAIDPLVFLRLLALFIFSAIGLDLFSRLFLAPVVTFAETTWTLAYRSWVGRPIPSS